MPMFAVYGALTAVMIFPAFVASLPVLPSLPMLAARGQAIEVNETTVPVG